MRRQLAVIIATALLASCGADIDGPEEPARTALAFSARDLEWLGPIEVAIDGYPFGIVAEEGLGVCAPDEGSEFHSVPIEQMSVHIRGWSEGGFRWDEELPLDGTSCQEFEFSLDNVATVFWACLPLSESATPLELWVDGELMGVATEAEDWEERGFFTSLEEARRVFLALAEEGKAAVFRGNPGNYRIACTVSGAPRRPKNETLFPGTVGYELLDRMRY